MNRPPIPSSPAVSLQIPVACEPVERILMLTHPFSPGSSNGRFFLATLRRIGISLLCVFVFLLSSAPSKIKLNPARSGPIGLASAPKARTPLSRPETSNERSCRGALLVKHRLKHSRCEVPSDG